MTQQLQTPGYTYAEFAALHEGAQKRGIGLGYELDEGGLLLMAPLDPTQGHVQIVFGSQLTTHVIQNGLGAVFLDSFTDFGLRRWYYPDLTYLSNDDLTRFDGRKLPVPATLIVEVATGSSLDRDAGRKKSVYHRAGVSWYWIVDLVAEEILEFRHAPAGYDLAARVGLYDPFRPALFPGLTIQLAPLIPRTQP
jgi:Uma2 family endonuclease